MHSRRLGPVTSAVFPLGLGCVEMSRGHHGSQRDDEACVDVIRQALDAAAPLLLDTADAYGAGHNETLVGRALAGRRYDAVLATKVGVVVDDPTARTLGRNGSPAHIRRSVEASLRRLGVDSLDLYYLHRVDPAVPLAESWGALAELVGEGKVHQLGLCEVTREQADAAHRIHPVAAVQSELSLFSREPLAPGTGMVGWCAVHDAAFVPFAPLGRGELTRRPTTHEDVESGDARAFGPDLRSEVSAADLRVVQATETVAARHGATAAQVALAWTLAQGDHIVPVPGTKQLGCLKDNLAAVDLHLTEQDLRELDAAPADARGRR